MRPFSKILAAFLAVLPGAPALAATTEDEQMWVNITALGSIKGDLVYFAEVQPRVGNGVSRLSQLLIRPAIGWKITPTLTLYQGYAHVVLPQQGARDRNEERSFQQLSWVHKIGRFELQTRTRLEQRWLSNGNDTGWRLRQFVRGEYPLTDKPKGVAAMAWVEEFVALKDTDWGARKGHDQLRVFTGVEVPLAGRSTIELGYMNQTINQTAGRRQMNHIASITLWLRH